jgi:hypothetical protein
MRNLDLEEFEWTLIKNILSQWKNFIWSMR